MSGSGFRTAVAAAVVVGVCACTLGLAPASRAHIVLGDRTLQLLLADADVALRGRITDVRAVPAASGMTSQRPTVGAVVLEVLKGDVATDTIRFAQHGHGVATYHTGEDVLLFLRRTERSRELAALAEQGVAYVSLQEHDEKYIVPAGENPPALSAARSYLRASLLSDPDARRLALGEVWLAMLRSGDDRLAAEAVQGVALAEGVTPFDATQTAAWLALLDDEKLPISVRLGLLVEFGRRRLVESETRWTALLASTRGSDRTAVIRAARRHPSPAVAKALLALLEGDDPVAAREAAIAIGWPGYSAAVAPLEKAIRSDDARLRMAAVRGLGAVGTAEALKVLDAAGRTHPDPATQRRAAAEARRLGAASRGQRASASAPDDEAVDTTESESTDR